MIGVGEGEKGPAAEDFECAKYQPLTPARVRDATPTDELQMSARTHSGQL
jgi:hypothetical protein